MNKIEITFEPKYIDEPLDPYHHGDYSCTYATLQYVVDGVVRYEEGAVTPVSARRLATFKIAAARRVDHEDFTDIPGYIKPSERCMGEVSRRHEDDLV